MSAVVRAGARVAADAKIVGAAQGQYGFALRPALLGRMWAGADLAWAVVGSLDDPAYKRAAALLYLARAGDKRVVGPRGETISFAAWLERAHISIGPLAMVRAGIATLSAPHRRARARRLLRGLRPPWGLMRVNIGISDRCNHRCIMCSEHSPYCAEAGRRMAGEDVSDESDFGLMEERVYYDLVRDLVVLGTREVELCGTGEPLVHPKFLDFVRAAKEAGFWMRVVTNGGLLTEARARQVADLGVDEVHFSVNGATAETHARVHGVSPSAFGRVLAGIRALADAHRELGAADRRIETSFVVQALNYKEPMQWVKTVAEAGSRIITFAALGEAPATAPVALTPEQLEKAKENVAEAAAWARSQGLHVRGTFGALADSGPAYSASLYTHMPCYIGHIYSIVTASGRIHPCCACARVVGDLREGGFAQAWRGQAYRGFREECLDLPNRLPAVDGCDCMSCPYGPWNVEFHKRLHGS